MGAYYLQREPLKIYKYETNDTRAIEFHRYLFFLKQTNTELGTETSSLVIVYNFDCFWFILIKEKLNDFSI